MKKLLTILATLGLIATAFAQETQTIESSLQGKTPAAIAQIKGKEMAKIAKGKYNRGKISIEIVDRKEINGGVEVFARAWKNGKQIGFGKDGTVDIERFRIFNPPILVDDPAGKIVREWGEKRPDGTIAMKRRTLREDPKEALLQVIEHNLAIMKNVHDGSAIIVGKRGNTTSTFYPAAGNNSPIDGWIRASGASWAAAHDATDGSVVNTTNTTLLLETQHDGGTFIIARIMTLFDTSSITSTNTITAATWSGYVSETSDNDNDGQDYISLVTATPAANNALSTADFDQFGSTKQSGDLDIGSITTGYHTLTLNATGLGNISKTGITKFGVREGHDIENASISSTGTNINSVTMYAADNSGTTADPKLVVEHELVVTGSHVPQQLILY